MEIYSVYNVLNVLEDQPLDGSVINRYEIVCWNTNDQAASKFALSLG